MKRILITDDSVTIVKLLTLFLNDYKGEEFTIFKAKDGADALFKLSKDKIDIVFLDLNMPIVDGYSVVEFIVDREIDVEVVIITSTLNKDSIRRLGKLGIKNFLPKPITADRVETMLEKLKKA